METLSLFQLYSIKLYTLCGKMIVTNAPFNVFETSYLWAKYP
jgi:hypothetical protein